MGIEFLRMASEGEGTRTDAEGCPVP